MDFIDEQREIFEHFGEKAQWGKLLEEMVELIEAENSGIVEHIEEELADVHNVLMQLIGHYNTHRINDIAIAKIERTKMRIKECYYNER